MAEGWNNRMGVASRMAPGIVLAAVMLLAQALPAYGASEWQTYLEDDFSSAETMFYTGQAGEAFYAIDDQGRYVIDGLTTASDSLTALTDNLYYYYLEGQCELLRSTAGELAFNGLVFHYNKSIPGKLSYYVFYVYGDGYYGAKRVTGDSVDIIIPLTPTDLLDPYGVNILGVDAQGTRFDLYLNGRYVDGFTDVLIDGGGFGFYISKLSRGAFDDFTVKIERRAGGREETSLPAVTMSNVADGSGEGSFSGRRFPVIPKDPNRPTYSWEVGVDKTGKGSKIKDEPPVESLATELTPVAPEHIPPVTPAPEPAPASAPMVEPKPEAVPEPVAEPEPEPEPEPEIKPESVPEPAPSDGAAVADAAPVVETLRPVAPAELRLPPGEELIEAPPIVASGTAGDEVRVTTETVTDGAPPVSQLLDVTTYGAPVADAAPGEAQEVTPVATPPVEEPAPESEPAPAPRLLTAPVIPRIESPFAQAPRDAGEPPAQEADTPPEPMVDEPAVEAPSEDTVEDEPLMLLPAEEDTVAMQIGEPTPEPASEAPIAEQPAALEPAEELLLSLLPAAEDREATQPRMPEDRQPETGLPPAEPTVDTGTAEDAPRQPSAREIADAMRDHSDWGEADDVAQDYGVADGFDDDSGGIDLEPIRKAPVEPPATQPEPDSSTASAEELLTETSDAEPTLSLLPSEDATPVPEQQGDRVVFSVTQPKYEGLDDLANRRAAGDDAAPADDTGTLELGLLPSDDGQPTLTAPVDDYFSREGLIVIEDDFSEESWPVSEGGAGNYRYFGAAYEIDNTGSATMAISYQNAALADCELNVDVEFLDGDSLVGFGLAGRFRVVDGRVSYYGLFVSQSGEFLLLKVLDGAEHVLADWTAATTLKPGASNRITLDLRGNELAAVINGEVVVTVQDMSIADGGYALLAGPGTAVRFDELLIRGYQR